MNPGERWLAASVMLLAVVVMSRGSPAMTGEAPSYLAIAHSIAHDFDLDLRNEYSEGSAFAFEYHASADLTAYGEDGRLRATQGLGWGLAMAPVLAGLEAFVGVLPESFLQRVRWDRNRALRDLLSTVMAGLAAWAAVRTRRLACELGVPSGWSTFAAALAFMTPPLLFAAINLGTEMPAALLCLWFVNEEFVNEERRAGRAPWRAAIPLALLPWLHLRYALIVLAGMAWMARRSRSAVVVPLASFVLLAVVNVALVGTPAVFARPFVSLWPWVESVPSVFVGFQTGLLWVAPFWLIALAGTRMVDGEWPGYARFAWHSAIGVVLAGGLFDIPRDASAARLTLAPVLPLLVPLLAQGLSAPAGWPRRALAGVTAAWAIALTGLVISEPGQMIAASQAGPVPAITASIRAWNSPQAKLSRRGYAVDEGGFAESIRKGDLEAVAIFLDAGFPVGRGLMVAVGARQMDSVTALLERGAAALPEAARALELARVQAQENTAQALMASGATLDVPDRSGQTVLMSAVRYREADRRAMLLALGANVNARTRVGDTALALAVRANDVAALEDLIQAGADLDLPDLDGWTPLMVAVRRGQTDAAQALMAAGADVNARSRLGWTSLMWAASDGSPEMVAALLASGADPNVTSIAGRTALIRAAGAGHLDVVRLLLNAGADPAVSINGEDARAWASRNGHTAVADLLARARRPS